MKGLFMVFHGMSAHSGISKKIGYQCDAITHNGVPTELCCLHVTPEGTRQRTIGGVAIADFGGGIRGRLMHRLSFADVTRYILHHEIGFLYIRYDHNPTPFSIAWLRTLKHLGVKIALEIPTYPYDAEGRGQRFSIRFKLFIDRCLRRPMMRYVDRIVTFSDDEHIFGRPTIRISNGIDFDHIPLKITYEEHPAELRLLGVANIHLWHAFDRVIAGMADYYATNPTRIVRFRIVGDGDSRVIAEYRRMIREKGLGTYVEISGPLSGAALDEAFEQCDMGIASLGRHRNGISKIKTLKNREYAARGIPFVYSETDDDFDAMPYVMKARADESPIDITALIHFRDTLGMQPHAIRETIEGTLSWNKQMEKVLQQMDVI